MVLRLKKTWKEDLMKGSYHLIGALGYLFIIIVYVIVLTQADLTLYSRIVRIGLFIYGLMYSGRAVYRQYMEW